MCLGEITNGLVALGANLPSDVGDPPATIEMAFAALSEIAAGPLAQSKMYQTPAFPAGSGPDYVNAAAAVPWRGTAETLLLALHRIEAAAGRTRSARWEARILDLDLLSFGEAVLPDAKTEETWRLLPPDAAMHATPDQLILPHPRLSERGFVLVPLIEIAPDWRHPVTGLTVTAMHAMLSPEERAAIRPI
ncbi:MAG: 2-amino-4-hydroxy-6-hydroxymethyldihydropteridine diphosphokinase [Pseudomonadota bacterium]